MPALEIIVAIPLVTACIGYGTNVAGVRMIFHPSRFIGFGPIGWQGIIYRLAPKFANEIAATTSEVLTPEDILRQLAPSSVADLPATLDTAIEPIVARLADRIRPGLWDELAPAAREALLDQVRKETVEAGSELVERLAPVADELLDLPALVVEMLSGEEADRLARVSKEIMAKELRFIEWSGGAIGFGVGLLQVLLYGIFGQWWTMPIVGAVVGLGTNWLAIQMVFRPWEPTRFLGLITYQGMFPKRQPEIARDYGRIAAHEVLTPANLLRTLRERGDTERATAVVREVVAERLDALQPMFEMLAGGATPPPPAVLAGAMLEELGREPGLEAGIEAHLEERLGIDDMIEERLGGLPKPEFERMLRGVFEEDEIILIAIGGVLGFAVGSLQAALVLALES
ncbi:MAG: DUF445 family protein [Acidimicrobiales bacterium]